MATILFSEAWNEKENNNNSSTKTFSNNTLEGENISTDSIIQAIEELKNNVKFKDFLSSLKEDSATNSVG